MRDSSFDPMNRNKGKSAPIGMDPMHKLGKELGQVPLSARDQFMDEDDEELQRKKEEEEKKRKANMSPYRELYRDAQGNLYDPTKKFGIIEPDSLIYENVTSSYPLNLPTDYYHKYIQ